MQDSQHAVLQKKMMHTKSPVAFFIFNRPSVTEKVFDLIRQAQPSRLLVVADGVRSAEEEAKCLQTRAILERVDWDCEVLKNFSDENLGCKRRVSSGLDWVFSNVEEAIILEDDCLPAPSFFNFCDSLLAKYRDDERVMHIGGTNTQAGTKRSNDSYYFSKYAHVWGWASWRRAWKHYDVNMSVAPDFASVVKSQCASQHEQNYWLNIFNRVANNEIDTWDYQWLYTCWTQHGLSVVPEINLVSNIGFGAEATHTFDEHHSLSRMQTGEIRDVKHPTACYRNAEADALVFQNSYGGAPIRTRGLLDRAMPYMKPSRTNIAKLIKRFVHA